MDCKGYWHEEETSVIASDLRLHDFREVYDSLLHP